MTTETHGPDHEPTIGEVGVHGILPGVGLKRGEPVTDTHGPDLTQTIPQCDAFLAERRVRASGWGLELVQCRVTRGLSAFRDHQGMTRRACGAYGHASSVVRRFGVMENEPDWALR